MQIVPDCDNRCDQYFTAFCMTVCDKNRAIDACRRAYAESLYLREVAYQMALDGQVRKIMEKVNDPPR